MRRNLRVGMILRCEIDSVQVEDQEGSMLYGGGSLFELIHRLHYWRQGLGAESRDTEYRVRG